jgi:predicted NAD/FAD-binding protein
MTEYCWLTLGTDHFVVTHGVQDVVARLTKPIKHLHLSTRVDALVSNADGSVFVNATTAEGLQEFGPFEHVVIGTQANQAVKLLESLTSTSAQVQAESDGLLSLLEPLRKFHYVE